MVVDATDDQAAAFYCHFDVDELDDRHLWRRLAGVAPRAPSESRPLAPLAQSSDDPGFASTACTSLGQFGGSGPSGRDW